MFNEWYRDIGKRLFDVIVAILALILLAPLMALVAVLVYVNLGLPILFRQQRPGWHEQPFTVPKFRTMTDKRDADGRLLPAMQRLTTLGRLLRKTSLDELPQFSSVLSGEMSLIGPRPLHTHYLPYYTEREHQRHVVRPGITGLAQIHGRNVLNWDQRLEFDVQYVDRLTFTLDLYILCITVWKVIAGSDNEVAPRTTLRPLTEYRQQRTEPPT